MTTWPDVVDKAITVGLPILFAAAVTLYAAGRERRYRDRVDRRQRARVALEQFVISFNKLHDANMRDWLITKKLLLNPVTLNADQLAQRLATLDAIDAQMIDLANHTSVIMLLGFNKSVDQATEYHRATRSLLTLFSRDPAPSKDEIDSSFNTIIAAQSRMMIALIEAYQTL